MTDEPHIESPQEQAARLPESERPLVAKLEREYTGACHAMQSGVAFEQGRAATFGNGPPELDPDHPLGRHLKHERVGINVAHCDHAALVTLLIQKGVFTLPEYAAARRNEMQREDVFEVLAQVDLVHCKIKSMGKYGRTKLVSMAAKSSAVKSVLLSLEGGEKYAKAMNANANPLAIMIENEPAKIEGVEQHATEIGPRA